MADKQLNNLLALQEDSELYGKNGTEHGKFKAGFLGVHNLLHVQEQKPAGTTGGTFTADAWRTRAINAVKCNNIIGASLSGLFAVTLPSGIYFADGYATGYQVEAHCARLFNITDSAELVIGTMAFTNKSYGCENFAKMSGIFSIDETKAIEFQHICDTTMATYGFGGRSATTFTMASEVNIYSDLKIWKLS